MKKFNIHHEEGYILEKDKEALQPYPGIYVVYKCDYNPHDRTVDIKDILYIGEAENIFKRHNSDTPHEHLEDFKRYAGGEEHVCYGEILLQDMSEEDRKTIEAAMIHIQQPLINWSSTFHYTKPASDILMTGGPDCWKRKHFIHPINNGDEIGTDTLEEYLKRALEGGK